MSPFGGERGRREVKRSLASDSLEWVLFVRVVFLSQSVRVLAVCGPAGIAARVAVGAWCL